MPHNYKKNRFSFEKQLPIFAVALAALIIGLIWPGNYSHAEPAQIAAEPAGVSSRSVQKHINYLQNIRTNQWESEKPTPTPSPVPLGVEVINNKSPLDIPNITIGKVEVNLSEQKAYIFGVNGELLFSSLVVTGKNGHLTPTGTYKIQSKRAFFYMNGNLAGETWHVWTNYASFFTGLGHALHDSPWRSRFGPAAGRAYNGSHGCVNMPTPSASYIFRNASIGTSVWNHY
ncbi:MAG: L,D-transpeptidase [bacterium]